MSFAAIIADDEPLARKSVRKFLRNSDIEILEECGDGGATLAALRNHKVDLLFLDMDMPTLKGMEILKAVGEKRMPTTIILTAHEHFALEAYDFAVADYILKPFGKERFERGLARAIARASDISNLGPKSPDLAIVDRACKHQTYPEHVPVPNRHGRICLIQTRDIEWVEAEENFLLIHCGASVHELRETLSAFQERLNPNTFYRIHRSTIVNANFIRNILPWRNGHHVIHMKNGRELRMSRYQRASVERLTSLSRRNSE